MNNMMIPSMKLIDLVIFILYVNSYICLGILFPFKTRKTSQIGIHYFEDKLDYEELQSQSISKPYLNSNSIRRQFSSRLSSPRNKLVKSQNRKMKSFTTENKIKVGKLKQKVSLSSSLDKTDSEILSPSLPSVMESTLPAMDVKEKVTNSFVEGLLTEVLNGLTQSGVMASPFPMHSLLLDLSMCVWTTLQSYQQYRNRELWSCDEDMCELMEDEITTCSPSVASGAPVNGAGGGLAGTGAMVSFLIPVMSDTIDKSNGTIAVASHSHHHMGRFIYGSDFTGAESIRTSPSPKPSISTTTLSTKNIGRSLVQYALVTMLVNVVSHELLPMALHAAEGAVQQVMTSLTMVAD
mmetsp:Transcript_15857/g.21841  ORF Transcript_15857/g.21841 Transcript_15857/m.21841 type:complete len:351 (+) Transcript_15857:74-1126(+)